MTGSVGSPFGSPFAIPQAKLEQPSMRADQWLRHPHETSAGGFRRSDCLGPAPVASPGIVELPGCDIERRAAAGHRELRVICAITPGIGHHCRDSAAATTVVWEAEMAQRVIVALQDDLDGGPAEETVRFAFDGTEYEIDLSARNVRALRKKLATFVEHARKAGRGPGRRTARTPAGRQRSGEVRAWAREHGIAVSARGRIPATVIEQYQASSQGH